MPWPRRRERLSGSSTAVGSTPIAGTLSAGDPSPGLTFVGLFSHPLPQQRPLACTLLAAPGPFRLNAPKPGRYYLFAACFCLSSDPMDFLLASRAARQVASGGPYDMQPGETVGSVELRLRPLRALDPPLLVALPLLVAERRARTILREPAEVIQRVSIGA